MSSLDNFAEMIFITNDKNISDPTHFIFSISNEQNCYHYFLLSFSHYQQIPFDLTIRQIVSKNQKHKQTSNIITLEMLQRCAAKKIIPNLPIITNNPTLLGVVPNKK